MQNTFPTYPNVDCYFPSAAMEKARLRLTDLLASGAGPGLLIGAVGCGKSLLLQTLARLLNEDDRFERVSVVDYGPITSTRTLLQSICFAAEVSYEGRDEGELSLALQQKFRQVGKSGKSLALLIDDGQSIPQATLEELRLLTSVAVGGKPAVSLVLAGTSSLEEQFAAPALECFQQRISARCYLAPMNRDETKKYFLSHLQQTSATASLQLEAGVTDAVFEITDGVPRLINQLGGAVLGSIASTSDGPVTTAQVQRAWAESQQLPGMWEAMPDTSEVAGVPTTPAAIEFGSLNPETGESSPAAFATTPFQSAAGDETTDRASITQSEAAKAAGSPGDEVSASAQFDVGESAVANLAAATLAPEDLSKGDSETLARWTDDDPSLLEPFAPVEGDASRIASDAVPPVITAVPEQREAAPLQEPDMQGEQHAEPPQAEAAPHTINLSDPWPSVRELAQQGVFVEEPMLTGSFGTFDGGGVEEVTPAAANEELPLTTSEQSSCEDDCGDCPCNAAAELDEPQHEPLVQFETVAAEQSQQENSLQPVHEQTLIGEVVAKSADVRPSFEQEEDQTRDPFDTPYEEEEILLNNYALLGEVLLQGRTRVTSSIEDGITSMVRSVMEVVEVQQIDIDPDEVADVESQPTEEVTTPQWGTTQVNDILVIENDDDEALVRAGIGRGEYPDLFAQLRGES